MPNVKGVGAVGTESAGPGKPKWGFRRLALFVCAQLVLILILLEIALRIGVGLSLELRGDIAFSWIDELEEGDGALGEEWLEEVAAGALAVHVLDHHARGLERPRFFDWQREGERARELFVVGWLR